MNNSLNNFDLGLDQTLVIDKLKAGMLLEMVSDLATQVSELTDKTASEVQEEVANKYGFPTESAAQHLEDLASWTELALNRKYNNMQAALSRMLDCTETLRNNTQLRKIDAEELVSRIDGLNNYIIVALADVKALLSVKDFRSDT